MIKIRFTDLHVDEIQSSAGVFTGHNQQLKWQTANVADNQGFGTIRGHDNRAVNHMNTVISSRSSTD
ncbi:hypothetical protein [Tuberibacillus sp. Marseille-P3662]|uniref:hypothetical protein n=1 Tax=Tuberibacillus sp. Marseille-P3662 TaxID=1965358 RepID=UPI000A1C9982|nr:hypothetical protein [Tuberibacillus sp. Marseille-P3662]